MPLNSDSLLPVTSDISTLRQQVTCWRQAGKKVGFVPTMGALHDGHLSLIKEAQRRADKVITSIFINPAQFSPDEDFDAYPRAHTSDLERLTNAKCDWAFLPKQEHIYPEGYATVIDTGPLAMRLCGKTRPHFFGGVATIVAKLLNICTPDLVIFGEKDYQQLLLIRRMVQDLNMPVQIVAAPIIREPDGLALSSRNRYLTPDQRAIAGQLNKILHDMAESIKAGEIIEKILHDGRSAILKDGFDHIDYLELCREDDLSTLSHARLSTFDRLQARLFAAVFIGKTRLIDNRKVVSLG